jgi:hypothetical protein
MCNPIPVVKKIIWDEELSSGACPKSLTYQLSTLQPGSRQTKRKRDDTGDEGPEPKKLKTFHLRLLTATPYVTQVVWIYFDEDCTCGAAEVDKCEYKCVV